MPYNLNHDKEEISELKKRFEAMLTYDLIIREAEIKMLLGKDEKQALTLRRQQYLEACLDLIQDEIAHRLYRDV